MNDKLIFGVIIFFMLMFGATIVVFNFAQTKSHEDAHVNFNVYNGAKSSVVLNFLGQSYATVDSNFPSEESRMAAYQGHMMNEAIAYNLVPMFNMLGTIFIIGFAFLGAVIWLK